MRRRYRRPCSGGPKSRRSDSKMGRRGPNARRRALIARRRGLFPLRRGSNLRRRMPNVRRRGLNPWRRGLNLRRRDRNARRLDPNPWRRGRNPRRRGPNFWKRSPNFAPPPSRQAEAGSVMRARTQTNRHTDSSTARAARPGDPRRGRPASQRTIHRRQHLAGPRREHTSSAASSILVSAALAGEWRAGEGFGFEIRNLRTKGGGRLEILDLKI